MNFVYLEEKLAGLSYVPKNLLDSLVNQTLQFIARNRVDLDARDIFENAAVDEEYIPQLQKACEGLYGVLSWIVANNPENEGKFNIESILGTHSNLEDEKIDTIKLAYESARDIVQETQHPNISNILLTSECRAGVTLATDSMKSVGIPFVKMRLELANAQTGLRSRKVVHLMKSELEVRYMQELLKELKKIDAIMSNYS
jgi:hypothetical protein